MSTCEWTTDHVALYLYNELSVEDQRRLEEHAESCDSCTQLLAQERRFLQTLGKTEAPAVSDALLSQCRHDLMRGVYREDRAVSHGGAQPGWVTSIQAWLGSMRIAWQPTAAAALLALGFYAGRAIEMGPLADWRGVGTEQASLAPRTGAIGDIESIQLNPERDQVEIVVEEVSRRVIQGSPQDPAIRQLLISAVNEYPSSGVRMATLDVLRPGATDPEIRKVLLTAMTSDQNPGVRLKALEALQGQGEDPAVREALMQVLQADANPGMRVQAIDLLTEKPEPNMVGLLQNVVAYENNNYVRLKCQDTLRQLNASEDQF